MDEMYNTNLNNEPEGTTETKLEPVMNTESAVNAEPIVSAPVAPPDPVTPPAPVSTPTTSQYTYRAPNGGYAQPPYTSTRPQYQGYQAPGSYTYQNNAYATKPPQNGATQAAPPYTVATAKPEKKRSFSVITLIACMAATAILATFISASVTMYMLDDVDTGSSPVADGGGPNGYTSTTITNNTDNFVEAVAAKVQPSVVGIVTKFKYSTGGFFGSTSDKETQGSGVIYTSDGYIITNKHVIDYAINTGEVYVYLPGDLETAYKADIVGYDASVDIALLKIDAVNLPAAEIGTSADLKVGQNAVAVGNPGGLDLMGSVSVGYISGLNRELTIDSTTMKLIQTDSAINPGNSGGALVDNEGKLIGITNAKIVDEEFEGLGFAIPIDTVTEICDGIIAGKDTPKPYIGVQINTSYTKEMLERYGLPAGAVIDSVVDDGPADKAGIRRNDIIVSVGDSNVTDYNSLISAISKHKVGDTVKIRVYRNGEYHNLQVTLTANG